MAGTRRGARRPTKQRPKSVVAKVKKLQKAVRTIQKSQEKKYIDVFVDNATMNYTGTVKLLNPCAEGTTDKTRIGDKITVKSIYARCSVIGNATNQYNLMRIMVFVDMANQGADPTGPDLLETTADNLVALSPLDLNTAPRFKVLMDRVYAASNTGQQAFVMKFYKSFKSGLNCEYSGTAATDVYKKSIYLAYFSDVNTNDPTINWYSRIGYTDS